MKPNFDFEYTQNVAIYKPTSLKDYNITITPETEEQKFLYNVIWDKMPYYDLKPKHYYGDTYYIGNVYILEQLMESGDFTETDDTKEPFVFVYDGATFNIYTTDTNPTHTVSLVYKDNEIMQDMETVHAYSIGFCKDRAVQEVYLHQQATDTVQIVCVPIYSLDVNTVIYLDDEKLGAVGEYVITNISCGLGAGDTMSITANKLW